MSVPAVHVKMVVLATMAKGPSAAPVRLGSVVLHVKKPLMSVPRHRALEGERALMELECILASVPKGSLDQIAPGT